MPAHPAWCLPLATAVPANASAVLLNVTAVDSDGPGYIQVLGSGGRTGTTSNLNKTAGITTANQVTVFLAPGSVYGISSGYLTTVANQGSATHLVVDLEGYYVPAAQTPVGSARS